RAIMWRPPWDLRVEEERDGGRRIAVWNDQEHWLYDSRLPYVLHTGLDVSGLNAPEPPTGLRRPLSPAHKAAHCAWRRSQGAGGGRPHPATRGRAVRGAGRGGRAAGRSMWSRAAVPTPTAATGSTGTITSRGKKNTTVPVARWWASSSARPWTLTPSWGMSFS